MLTSMLQMITLKRRYWKQFWNYIDLLLVVFATFSIVSQLVRVMVVNADLQEQLKHTDKFVNFYDQSLWQMITNACVAIMVLLAWFKVCALNETC